METEGRRNAGGSVEKDERGRRTPVGEEIGRRARYRWRDVLGLYIDQRGATEGCLVSWCSLDAGMGGGMRRRAKGKRYHKGAVKHSDAVSKRT